MNFADLGLAESIVRSVVSEGYSTPTPIQAQAIPHVLAGRDVLGCAQTGTGKTAAFALPILQNLAQRQGAAPSLPNARSAIRCLVLAPTRELASQIGQSFSAYGRHSGLRSTVIFGGVGQNPQVDALRRGVDVLIATPGRLLDLINQRHADLSCVEVLVLDEADRMLDMGFIHDIRKIAAKLPAKRQTLLFSATMPREIRELANSLLRDPVSVQVTPVASTVDKIDQSVYFVEKRNKPQLLTHLLKNNGIFRALVFTRTKHGADRVVRHLYKAGFHAEAIHGNKSQNARQRALHNFKTGKTPVLVASDIAARGLDVDDISHVVNYDLTNEPETYVHRIGRTARAGASGSAISFCDAEERAYLRDIERLIRKAIPVKSDHPKYAEAHAHATHEPRAPRPAHPKHRSVSPSRPAHRPAQAPADKSHAPRRQAGKSHPSAPARHPHPLWSYGSARGRGTAKPTHRAR